MTLDCLRIFCDVVRQRSFSRGAELNGVTQSAASQTIHQIEKRLGVRLIDRSRRPFVLTPEGRTYYDGCKDLIDGYLAVEARTRSSHDDAAARLIVASIYSVDLYDMHQYVRRLQALCPGSHIRLDYLHPNKVYERVLNDEADLGLISCPRAPRELQVIPWRDEPMVLVCRPGHPFTRQTGLPLSQLNGEDFVAFDSDLAIRRHVDRYLRQCRVNTHVIMEFDNVEAIKRALEFGAGVSFLPEPTVRREVASGTLAVVPVAELDLVRPLCIIRRRAGRTTPAMTSFMDLLTSRNGATAADDEDHGPEHAAPSEAGCAPEESVRAKAVAAT